MNTNRLYLILAGSFLGLISPLWSQNPTASLEWGAPPGTAVLDGDANLVSATYTFQLGYFTGDFSPEESNTNQWKMNWQAVDESSYNTQFQTFGGSLLLTVASDGVHLAEAFLGTGEAIEPPVFEPSSQLYLWGFNFDSKEDAGAEQLDWFLYTEEDNDVWQLPSASLDEHAFSQQVSVSSPPNVPVLGVFTETTISTTPVPEPSSALLLVIGAGLIARRRRA